MNTKYIIDYIENVLRKEKGVPGCAVKVTLDQKEVFAYTSGESDYEKSIPVSENDIYHIYSCSKPFTCTAAMQLVESGDISLDDPVSKYLPAFENVFIMKDQKKCAPERTMTVRHLFMMSGGLDYDLNAKPICDLINNDPEASTMDIINTLPLSPLKFEPGERFLYSLCHDVLGAVVESATKMKLSEYMEKNIFAPLGITDTCFKLSGEKEKRLSAQYIYTDGKGLSPLSGNNYRLAVNYESGGAGLCSTVKDLSLFADAMTNGGVGISGNCILRSETIDLMRTEQLSKHLVDPSFSCAVGPGYGYGLGVRTMMDRSEGQRSAVGEFGWDGAAGSFILMDPENRVSIAYTMHVRSWPLMLGSGHGPLRDVIYEGLGI